MEMRNARNADIGLRVDHLKGECRRFPPIIVVLSERGNVGTFYPKTCGTSEWCGEFMR